MMQDLRECEERAAVARQPLGPRRRRRSATSTDRPHDATSTACAVALLAGLVAAACAAPRGSTPRQEPGGAPGAALAPKAVPPPPAAVSFALELVDPAAPLVGIHVEAPGDSDGTSEFTLAEGWGGIVETGQDLELVEARDSAELLQHERVNSYTWRVHHAPAAPLALVFELRPTGHRASTGPPEYYLPILEAGLLHALGAQTLPAPTHLDGGTERPITFAWRGFAEAGWTTVSSFSGGGVNEVRVESSLDDFRHSLFLAGLTGDLRLVAHDVHGRPVWVAMHGEWHFSDDDFQALVARIVELEREFFSDFDRPHYLISLLQVGAGSAQSSSYGGTGLTDSFALFVTSEMDLTPMPGGGGIAWLLAHELFHDWNGHAITLEQPEELGYWFSEGFTDFYARRLLAEGGLLDRAGFVDSWNHKLASHAANPERFSPIERVREAFWSSREVGEIPYQRGDLIALYVDHEIRERSGGARSLDDLMRELVRRGRAGGEPQSNASLCAAVAEFAGEDAAETVRRWAVDGLEPELGEDLAGPDYVLEHVDIPTFDTGFDHEATMQSGSVIGVRAGSAAEVAGLRDGMRLSAWSVNFGDTSQPIELSVNEGGSRRRISYLPHGAPVSGYRLRAR